MSRGDPCCIRSGGGYIGPVMIARAGAYFRGMPGALWVLSFGWFVSALGFGIAIPFISIYFHGTLGLSITQIGLFFGVMAVVRSVFQILGGEIADRMERRSLMIHTQVIRALSFFVMGIAVYQDWGFPAIAGSLLINSVFGALFQPVANAAVSDILPEKQRLDGFAITRSAINLGWAAGPALGGFLAGYSYGFLFVMSGVITFGSALVFLVFLARTEMERLPDRFRFSDLVAIKDDPWLAIHAALIFLLFMVHSQLLAPFSIYAVQMVGISESQLGLLYTLNGLIVVTLQVPVTRMLSGFRLTSQMAAGALIYAAGYTFIGFCSGLSMFVIAVLIVTCAEIVMSPASLTLTARLAPVHRKGRYMGIFGFAVSSGWSFGPLYGGLILDAAGHHPVTAWGLISVLAIAAGLGYLIFAARLPAKFNAPTPSTS
ncbi:hypothetical protein D3OALGB2SA_1737 [Olavius algarvensis associated proteobacterium Delta 3]|nr:hypothetical protein D3OALGB2SA_1737 [Olavius algarvensis associated proteobacterium Delta 3]